MSAEGRLMNLEFDALPTVGGIRQLLFFPEMHGADGWDGAVIRARVVGSPDFGAACWCSREAAPDVLPYVVDKLVAAIPV